MDQPIRVKIGYNKNITVRKNGHYVNVYINNNVFENGVRATDKSNSVWLKWEEDLELRDAINSIEERLMCVDVSSLS